MNRKKRKERNHVINCRDAKMCLQHSLPMYTLKKIFQLSRKLEIKGNFFYLITAICKTSLAKITFIYQRVLDSFPIKSWTGI